MVRFAAWPLLVVAALLAGCQSGPNAGAAKPPDQPAQEKEPEVVIAVTPADLAEGVILTPPFKWKLPPRLGMPTNVSFTLMELGSGEARPKAGGAAAKQVGFCSGLHDTSPTALDLFHPPAGSILTGDVRSMKGLKPNTWYAWTVRAISDDKSETGEFVFKTRP